MITFLRRLRIGSRLRRLRDERARALDAYRTAKSRGDTRSQHHAMRRLSEATHALMRAEVGHE